MMTTFKSSTGRRHDTQHNDIQHNDTRRNDTQHNRLSYDTQHRHIDIQHNSIECHYAECRDYLNVMPSVVRLNVIMLSVVAPKGKLIPVQNIN
jgi:hypothetical protein